MKEWIETKRTYKRREDGVVKTVIEELLEPSSKHDRQNIIDNTIKIAGACSILVPLFLFYLSYVQSNQQKNNEALSAIYVNVIVDVETIKSAPGGTPEFDAAFENLQYKYDSQIALFKKDNLEKRYSQISENCSEEKLLKQFYNTAYILINNFNSTVKDARIIEIKRDSIYSIAFPDTVRLLSSIDSWRTELNTYLTKDSTNTINGMKLLAIKHGNDKVFSKANTNTARIFNLLHSMDYFCVNLKLYITKKNRTVFMYYPPEGNSWMTFLTSPSYLLAPLSGITVAESKVEDSLTRNKDQFKNLVLSYIKN